MAPHDCTRTATAAEPLAGWLGGKKLLAKRIIARIDAIPHRCYAEPFVGMGGVFLRRTRKPKAEIINDRNGEIVNLFRVTREHPDELARQFRWCLASRQEFRRLIAVSPETLTDIQRAARFAYLQRLSFGGKPAHLLVNSQMGTDAHHPATLRAERMRRLIAAAHKRLQGAPRRVSRLGCLSRSFRPALDAVLHRPALLGPRERLRQGDLQPRRLRPHGRGS